MFWLINQKQNHLPYFISFQNSSFSNNITKCAGPQCLLQYRKSCRVCVVTQILRNEHKEPVFSAFRTNLSGGVDFFSRQAPLLGRTHPCAWLCKTPLTVHTQKYKCNCCCRSKGSTVYRIRSTTRTCSWIIHSYRAKCMITRPDLSWKDGVKLNLSIKTKL